MEQCCVCGARSQHQECSPFLPSLYWLPSSGNILSHTLLLPGYAQVTYCTAGVNTFERYNSLEATNPKSAAH